MGESITCAALRKEVSAAHAALDAAGIQPGPLPDRVSAAIAQLPPTWAQINDLLSQIQELTRDDDDDPHDDAD